MDDNFLSVQFCGNCVVSGYKLRFLAVIFETTPSPPIEFEVHRSVCIPRTVNEDSSLCISTCIHYEVKL